MTAYTTAAAIAAHLGVTLTPEQEAQAGVAAEAVTAWIDHRCGRSWQDADGGTADEQHAVTGGLIWLTNRPALAISAVEARTRGSGSPWAALDSDAWFLADASAGRLELPGRCDGEDVRVSYTHGVTEVPPDLAFAATVLASDLMTTALHPESHGVSQLSVGQNDINIRYATASEREGGSEITNAVAVVDSYRPRVVLA